MAKPSEINVRVVPPGGQLQEASGAPLTERLADRIDELGGSLGEIANQLRARLDAELTEPSSGGFALEEVALTFTLDLETEAGVVVAKAKAAAGFEAALTWRRASGTAG